MAKPPQLFPVDKEEQQVWFDPSLMTELLTLSLWVGPETLQRKSVCTHCVLIASLTTHRLQPQLRVGLMITADALPICLSISHSTFEQDMKIYLMYKSSSCNVICILYACIILIAIRNARKKIKKGPLLPVYACHIRTKLIINNPQLNLQNLMQTVKSERDTTRWYQGRMLLRSFG